MMYTHDAFLPMRNNVEPINMPFVFMSLIYAKYIIDVFAFTFVFKIRLTESRVRSKLVVIV